mmetsp:Transcript_18935/g.28465  ORF Transcript_18935/g.28465 Transcript_18935/m.28465 type:complete len:165 (+) Transcript_18935:67-561(+)
MALLIKPTRIVDGLFFSMLLLFAAGFSLYGCGELLKTAYLYEGRKTVAKITAVLKRIFPFSTGPGSKIEFELTHVLLFALLVLLMSMMHHEAQMTIQFAAENKAKKKKESRKEEQQGSQEKTSEEKAAELEEEEAKEAAKDKKSKDKDKEKDKKGKGAKPSKGK